MKRRGAKTANLGPDDSLSQPSPQPLALTNQPHRNEPKQNSSHVSNHFNVTSSLSGRQESDSVSEAWRAFAIASNSTVRNLVYVYFEIVYPM